MGGAVRKKKEKKKERRKERKKERKKGRERERERREGRKKKERKRKERKKKERKKEKGKNNRCSLLWSHMRTQGTFIRSFVRSSHPSKRARETGNQARRERERETDGMQ